jgi:predicted ATP-grasp superfamily ATP-dependent carboligase
LNLKKAIVLNGSYHNALIIVRSLAKKGVEVCIGSEAKGIESYFGEAMLSRHCKRRFLYPSPEKMPRLFIERINEVSKKYGADILLPVGADTCVAVSKFRDELNQKIRIPLSDDPQIQKAHDKYECLKFAESVGISIPRTELLRKLSDDDIDELTFPIILKPRKGAGNFGVRIIHDSNELKKLKDKASSNIKEKGREDNKHFLIYDQRDPIIQEYIDGQIVDACAIAEHGVVKAILTQIRLKTLPPEGGFGVMNRTIEIPEVRDQAIRLLESFGWHGVTQVEFKYDSKTRSYKLMEINPKFWGTLALSVAAGIDFPYLAYQLALNRKPIETVASFKENCVYRWVIPNEFFHVMESENKFSAFLRYLADFFKPAHYNIDLLDPLPFVALVLKLLKRPLASLLNRT